MPISASTVKQWCACLLLSLAPLSAVAQERESGQFGLELQAYPAGVIVTGSYTVTVSDQTELGISVGGNFTDRGDFGEHQNEEGDGFGAGLSYHRLFGAEGHGWFAGARVDAWRLQIDWEDPRAGALVVGVTDITVLQPTAVVGFRWPNGFDLTLSGGAEINVSTDGEDVGEGAIGLVGLRYRF